MNRTRSPLEEIEHTVQTRATSLDLDADTAEGRARLRTMIDEVIDEWAEDHRRGQHPFDLPDPGGLAARAFRNLARYGPLTELLEDDDVWEIMINAPDGTFSEVLLSGCAA